MLRKRLKDGASSYGDASLKLSIHHIFAEADVEFLDIPGWKFLAYAKDPDNPHFALMWEILASTFLNWCKFRQLHECADDIERAQSKHIDAQLKLESER
jgi:hypothetical protein